VAHFKVCVCVCVCACMCVCLRTAAQDVLDDVMRVCLCW